MYTLIYSCFISNTEINAGFFVGFRAENPWKGKYNMIRARIFRPARAGRNFLKLTASPFFILSNLAGPGERGRSSRAPNTPRLFLFLLEEKEAKDYLGGHPLKTPRGSALAAPHAGRPLLSLRDISPALRGNRPLPHGRDPWW